MVLLFNFLPNPLTETNKNVGPPWGQVLISQSSWGDTMSIFVSGARAHLVLRD